SRRVPGPRPGRLPVRPLPGDGVRRRPLRRRVGQRGGGTMTGIDPGQREDLVTLTIDGREVSVPEGTLVIRAAEQTGVEIPRFCDHTLLEPVRACRPCIVQVDGT